MLLVILVATVILVNWLYIKQEKKRIAKQIKQPELRERLSINAVKIWVGISNKCEPGETIHVNELLGIKNIEALETAGYINCGDSSQDHQGTWYECKLLVKASSIEELLRKGCANNYDTQTDSD